MPPDHHSHPAIVTRERALPLEQASAVFSHVLGVVHCLRRVREFALPTRLCTRRERQLGLNSRRRPLTSQNNLNRKSPAAGWLRSFLDFWMRRRGASSG